MGISKNVSDTVQLIYPAACKLTDNNPVFDTAQVALETGWLAKKVGNYNLAGMKAGKNWTGLKVLWTTTEIAKNVAELAQLKKSLPEIISIENRPDGTFKIHCKDWFMDFHDVQDFLEHHSTLLHSDNFKPALQFVNDPIKYVEAIQDKSICKYSYATDPNYVKTMTAIIKMVENAIVILKL